MSAQRNKQLVTEFWEAFSASKFEDALSMMAEDATWWVAGSFPLSGTKTKSEFAALLSDVAPMAPEGIRVTPTAFTAEGDRVAVEADSYAPISNGRTYKNKYHFLFEVRNGKIHAVREYLDTMHANEVLCEP
ncbi:MAG: nuclear transport factor 2 family protein [Myxococcales bacterium]|nr:nuclear transport factor 2 family protein [Myxococcales bacterium]